MHILGNIVIRVVPPPKTCFCQIIISFFIWLVSRWMPTFKLIIRDWICSEPVTGAVWFIFGKPHLLCSWDEHNTAYHPSLLGSRLNHYNIEVIQSKSQHLGNASSFLDCSSADVGALVRFPATATNRPFGLYTQCCNYYRDVSCVMCWFCPSQVKSWVFLKSTIWLAF